MNDQHPASNPPAGTASVNPLGTDLEVVADAQATYRHASGGTAYLGVLHHQAERYGLVWACEHEHDRPTQAIACAIGELDRRYGPLDDAAPRRTGGPVDLAAVNVRLDRAYDEVGDIAKHGTGRWRMSIPADPKRDSDLILSDALMDALRVVAELRAARGVIDLARSHVHPVDRPCRLASALAAYDEAIKGGAL